MMKNGKPNPLTTYERALTNVILDDDRYVVMTAENHSAIRNLPPLLKERFVDTGITEQGMIGAAAGLALRGRVPVVHGLAAFITMRGFEFIRTDVGLGNQPVKLVGTFSGFHSEANGATHQSLEDISLLRTIPNMKIVCPADEKDLEIALPVILQDESPCYIRFTDSPAVIQHDPEFRFGEAEIITEGSDITILTYGMLLNQAYQAQQVLESRGISVRLLNMRSLKPVDERAILKAARETEMLVVLEDHFQTGGLYSILCEVLVKNQMICEVMPYSLNNRWFKPGLLEDVLAYEKFAASDIVDTIFKRWLRDFC